MTTQHFSRQLRTSATNHLATALHGRPQCSNCHRCFTTWRSYIIHIQRDCCQVSLQRIPDPLALSTLPVMTPDRQLDQLHVASQSFWPTLKHLVSTQQWTDLGPEPDIGEHLTHSCMVCGLWMNRYQEMHSHYRLHHSDLFQGGVAKGVQLSALIGTDSPCILCSAEYQRVHSCPVTLQIGVLHILASSNETTTPATRCDICMQEFATLKLLYGHMFSSHDLTINDWCPARDAMANSDACAHCGSIFDSRSGLRRHITEGRCSDFDPLAPAQTCDVENTWGLMLRQGKVYKQDLSAVQRLRLTMTCQLCSMTYERQGDLVAHLLQSHGPIWQKITIHFAIFNPGCTHSISVPL